MESICYIYIKIQLNCILEKEEGKMKQEHQFDCSKVTMWEEG